MGQSASRRPSGWWPALLLMSSTLPTSPVGEHVGGVEFTGPIHQQRCS